MRKTCKSELWASPQNTCPVLLQASSSSETRVVRETDTAWGSLKSVMAERALPRGPGAEKGHQGKAPEVPVKCEGS